MAKRRKKGGRRKQKPSLLGLLAFAPVATTAIEGFRQNGLEGAVVQTTWAYSGFDIPNNKFDMNGLYKGLIPTAGILGVSMVGKKLGLNRYIPKWIPIKLF